MELEKHRRTKLNRDRAKELLPIIEAFANGEDIQFRVQADKECGSDVWAPHPSTGISLKSHVEYRIKPKAREFWMDPDDFEIFDQEKKPFPAAIKVVEVLCE